MKTMRHLRTRIFPTFSRLVRATAAVVLLVSSGCGSDNAPPVPAPVTLQDRYSSAVHDARTATPQEISRDLTPINADNGDLIWENGVPGSRVLVLSWIRCSDGKYYDGTVDPACKPGSSHCTLKVDLWVTVPPEMKDLFPNTPPDPLRIAQLLGLPPEYAAEERCMVELWISPRDMFRPCPDPEITDRECQTQFPSDPFRTFDSTELIRATEGPERNLFMNYTGWFNNRRTYLYDNPRNYPLSSPYPWTRLGYTYDWGSASHVGLSEFVVHGRKQDGGGITIGVRNVQTTSDYFKP